MVPLSNDSLWNEALMFLCDHYREAETRESIKEKLLRWERLPTELGLIQLMAEFTVPQRWPHIICDVPKNAICLGDIGITEWGTVDWRILTSQYPNQPEVSPTIVVVWNNEGPVSSVSNPASGWQSYEIGNWEADSQYMVVVNTSNMNNRAGDRALWRDLRQRSEEVANSHDIEPNRLEIGEAWESYRLGLLQPAH